MKVRIEGLREVDKALAELPKATGKAVLRRVLKQRAQPIADAMETGAPKDTGRLARSAGVSTKLNKTQRAKHRKMFKSDRASVEMFVGVAGLAQATMQEFGTVNHPPQPFARPAWDAGKEGLLDGIADDLGTEIDKAAKRLAKRRARASGG